MKKLTEGMRMGDLEDVVLPLITVDEYVSKLDNDAIVFGFFVDDQDAAIDLNRFIQKTAAAILDTEISPAPDQKGYYIVFFEIMNDDVIVDTLEEVLGEVSQLCLVEDWQFKIRSVKDLKSFNRDFLTKHFADMRKMEKRKSAKNDILEHFYPSALSHLEVTETQIHMAGMGLSQSYEFVSFDDNDQISERGHDLSFSSAISQRKILRMLGEGWTVDKVGDHLLVKRYDGGPTLCLKER